MEGKNTGHLARLPGSFRGNWAGAHATVVMLAFSSITVAVFSDRRAVNPSHTPKADLQKSIDTCANIVKILSLFPHVDDDEA